MSHWQRNIREAHGLIECPCGRRVPLRTTGTRCACGAVLSDDVDDRLARRRAAVRRASALVRQDRVTSNQGGAA